MPADIVSHQVDGFAKRGREVQGGSFQEGKSGTFVGSEGYKRDYYTVLEDSRFISDWNMYGTFSEGKINAC